MVQIITDSSPLYHPEEGKKLGFEVVPLCVNIGEFEGRDLLVDMNEFYDRIKKGGIPKSSQPPIGDVGDMYEKYRDAEIINISMADGLSGTYQSAMIAAEGRDYITILDTKEVSVGQGAIVVRVAEYLKEHPDTTIEELVSVANDYIARARMCFVPDNLEFLRAGGRVSNVAFLGSRILNIHPCIELLDGKLVATKKYRGKMIKVAANLIKDYAQNYQLERETLWFVHTIGLSEEVKAAAEVAAKECGFKEIRWILAGGVITTHGGPAAFGLAGFASK